MLKEWLVIEGFDTVIIWNASVNSTELRHLSQGCAQLMSREPNLIRLRLKLFESLNKSSNLIRVI